MAASAVARARQGRTVPPNDLRPLCLPGQGGLTQALSARHGHLHAEPDPRAPECRVLGAPLPPPRGEAEWSPRRGPRSQPRLSGPGLSASLSSLDREPAAPPPAQHHAMQCGPCLCCNLGPCRLGSVGGEPSSAPHRLSDLGLRCHHCRPHPAHHDVGVPGPRGGVDGRGSGRCLPPLRPSAPHGTGPVASLPWQRPLTAIPSHPLGARLPAASPSWGGHREDRDLG